MQAGSFYTQAGRPRCSYLGWRGSVFNDEPAGRAIVRSKASQLQLEPQEGFLATRGQHLHAFAFRYPSTRDGMKLGLKVGGHGTIYNAAKRAEVTVNRGL